MTPAESALIAACMKNPSQALGTVNPELAEALLALKIEQIGPVACDRYVSACTALVAAGKERHAASEALRALAGVDSTSFQALLNRLVPGSAAPPPETAPVSAPDTPDPEALKRLRERQRGQK